jgi:hypothetical protein
MHAAVRPYATTGVALVGAGVIAVTPLAPLPDVHIPTLRAPVALTQATNPYTQVFQQAVANLEAILSTAATNPTPILTKILSNQITTLQALLALLPASAAGVSAAPITPALASPTGALQALVAAIQLAVQQIVTAYTTGLDGLPPVPQILQTALADLTSANVEGAINNLLLAAFTTVFPLTGVTGPALGVIAAPLQTLATAIAGLGPIGEVLANPLQNLVNVLLIPTNQALVTELIVAGLINPLFIQPAAFGTAVQGVINAITGVPGSPSVLQAIVGAPAVYLGGLLNGEFDGMLFGPNLGPLVSAGLFPVDAFFGGLLNQAAFLPPVTPGNVATIFLTGFIPALQELQSTIAGVLTPPTIPTAGPLQLAKIAAPSAPSVVPNAAANKVTVNTTAPIALAPRVAAPTVGSGPVTKVLTSPTPTANKSNVVGGNGTELSGGLGKIAAVLSGGSGKHRS